MWWKLLTSRTAAQKQDHGKIETNPKGLSCYNMYFKATYTAHSKRERYLHDTEEEEDDEDADMWMEPCRRATKPGRSRRSLDFGPGEIIKKGVDALPGHQLPI